MKRNFFIFLVATSLSATATTFENGMYFQLFSGVFLSVFKWVFCCFQVRFQLFLIFLRSLRRRSFDDASHR